MCNNGRNVARGLHQIRKQLIFDTSPVRCYNFCRIFDDTVANFWEPYCLEIKNYIQTLGKWQLLLLMSSWFLCYLTYWTPTILPVRWCTWIFRVWRVLLKVFRKITPIIPHFFTEATCKFLANQRWCLGHQFHTENVKVNSCHCFFRHSGFTMTIYLLSWILKRTIKMISCCTQNPNFSLQIHS